MSDEVKTALAQLECYVEGNGRVLSLAAATAILDHVREQHKEREAREAAEGLPVTEEWLRSVGFLDGFGSFGLWIPIPSPSCCNVFLECSDYPNAESCPWQVWNIHSGTDRDGAMIVESLPTRGDVIRLCTALGVPFDEKGPEKEPVQPVCPECWEGGNPIRPGCDVFWYNIGLTGVKKAPTSPAT